MIGMALLCVVVGRYGFAAGVGYRLIPGSSGCGVVWRGESWSWCIGDEERSCVFVCWVRFVLSDNELVVEAGAQWLRRARPPYLGE
jgi:hypothetical protein